LFKRLIGVAFLAIMGVTAFTSCKYPISEKFKTQSIFQNLTCVPPCWQNIEPGKSSEQDVISYLKNIPDIDPNSIINRGEPWAIFDNVIYFSIHNEAVDGAVFLLNNKVAMIEFSERDFGKNLNMTIGEAIDEFGDPQYILNIQISFELTMNTIIAIQAQKGIIVSSDVGYINWESKTELSPKSEIKSISFFDPNIYDRLLDSQLISMLELDRADTLKNLVPWNGYGRIYTLYPPAKASPENR
jgi:hypothetical protein